VVITTLDGQVRRPGKLAPKVELLSLRDGVVQQTVDGVNLRFYVATQGRWRAAMVDQSDVRDAWALKQLARDLLMYLGAVIPSC
jgi:hypothetical protein